MEELISPYIDGELSVSEMEKVRAHLSVCADCGEEYESILRVSFALGQLRLTDIAAPTGFASSVMQQLSEERIVVRKQHKTHWLKRNWKQTAAGIAAAAMLMVGTLVSPLGPLVQIADNPPSVVQPGNTVSDGINNSSGDASSVPNIDNGVESPDSHSNITQIAQNPNAVDYSPMVFLSKDRALTTTFLEINPSDPSVAQQKTLNLASGVQAQVQNLGQQVNDNGSYTVFKITVAKSSASDLIIGLQNLGTVNNKELTKNDITSQFTDKLSQYQNLLYQRSALQDIEQIAVLDQRIKTLETELSDWDKRAEQETIILWLQK